MTGRALRVAELQRACLGLELALHQLFELFRRSRQHRMAKCVQVVFVRADFFARFVLDSFACHDHAMLVGIHRLLDLGQEFIRVECELGKEDNMRRIGRVAPFGQHRSGGDPPR